MNFAPYQDQPPEQERALSPPPRRSFSRSPPPPASTQRNLADPFLTGATGGGGGGNGIDATAESGRAGIDLFQTSLPIRLDYEAMLAYLLLPPAGGVLLLILEHQSDYVRFHAWQSSLLFSIAFIVHLVFSFSAVISWLLLALDLLAIGFLTLRAYRDADMLDRFEVPFIGRLASSFVDNE